MAVATLRVAVFVVQHKTQRFVSHKAVMANQSKSQQVSEQEHLAICGIILQTARPLPTLNRNARATFTQLMVNP